MTRILDRPGIRLRQKLFVPTSEVATRESTRIGDHPFLMFYGTLRDEAWQHWIDLPKEAKVVTGARMLGHLYLLGSRPILIPQNDSPTVVDGSGKRYEAVYVVGDLIDLSGLHRNQVEAIVRTLDSKEGVNARQPELGRYTRRLMAVQSPTSPEPIMAWVYACPQHERADVVQRGLRVEGGDYVAARDDARFSSPRTVAAQAALDHPIRTASFKALLASLDIPADIRGDINLNDEPLDVLRQLAPQNPQLALNILDGIRDRRFAWMRDVPEVLMNIERRLGSPEFFDELGKEQFVSTAVQFAGVVSALSRNSVVDFATDGRGIQIAAFLEKFQARILLIRDRKKTREEAAHLLAAETEIRLRIPADQQNISLRVQQLLDYLRADPTDTVWYSAAAVRAIAKWIAYAEDVPLADQAGELFTRLLENDHVSRYTQNAVVENMNILGARMSEDAKWRWAQFVIDHPYDPDFCPWTWNWEAAFATLSEMLPADEVALRISMLQRGVPSPVRGLRKDVREELRDRDYVVFQRALRALAASGHELVAWASKELDMGQRYRNIVFLEGVLMAARGWKSSRRQERTRQVLSRHQQFREQRLLGRKLYMRKGVEIEWWPPSFAPIFNDQDVMSDKERLDYLRSKRVYAMLEAFGLLTANEGYGEHASYPTVSGETQVHNFELMRRVGLFPSQFSYAVHINVGLPFPLRYFTTANPASGDAPKDVALRRQLDALWALMAVVYASDARINNMGSVVQNSANTKFPFRVHQDNVLVDPARLELRVFEYRPEMKVRDVARLLDTAHHLTVALFAPELAAYRESALGEAGYEALRHAWASYLDHANQFFESWGLRVPDYFTPRTVEAKEKRVRFERKLKGLRAEDPRFMADAERILSRHVAAIDTVIGSRTQHLGITMLRPLMKPGELSIL